MASLRNDSLTELKSGTEMGMHMLAAVSTQQTIIETQVKDLGHSLMGEFLVFAIPAVLLLAVFTVVMNRVAAKRRPRGRRRG